MKSLALFKTLTTFLLLGLLGSVNAEPNNFTLGDNDLSSKVKLLESQYVGGDEYIASLYSSGIDYDTNTIDSLLITSGYEPLNSTFDNLIIKRTIIEISDPFGIEVDGCSTVTANLDESLAVLLYAIKNAMGVLPNLVSSRISGMPNLDNPKEVFNWVYDMTTTVMCMGTAGVTQAVESSISAIPTYIKHLLTTTNDDETNTSSNTQMGVACGPLAGKDKYKEKVTQGENKNARETSQAELASDAIKKNNEKFHKCKNKYEEYKQYISKEISMLDIYRNGEVEKMKTSCDYIDAEEEKKAGDLFLPASGTWSFSNPFYLNIVQPEILGIAFGPIDVRMKFNDNNDVEKTEIIVDRNRVLDQLLNMSGVIASYATRENVSGGGWNYVKGNEIPEYIYDIGINYSNIITGCISGNPEYDAVCKSKDIEDYFPMELKPSVDIPSFLEQVKRQRLFCDLTDFNKTDKEFLLSSIGLVTILDSTQKGMDHSPTLDSFKDAINTVVLGDYCEEKINMNIDALEEKLMSAIKGEADKINEKEMAILSSSMIWKDQEMVITKPVQYEDKGQVIKVCNVFKEQENFYIATLKDGEAKAEIQEITAKFSANHIIDIKGLEKEFTDLTTEANNCADDGNKCIENAIYSPIEIEMLCNESASIDTCEANQLSCGVNFQKKSSRKDNLYVDGDDATKPKGAYAQYEKKRREEKLDASEDDFNQNFEKGFKKDIDKIINFSKTVLSPAAKDLSMFVNMEIKKQMIVLRK